jgi:hypothetical protein
MATAEQIVERNMTAFNAKDKDKFLSNRLRMLSCPDLEGSLSAGGTKSGSRYRRSGTHFPTGRPAGPFVIVYPDRASVPLENETRAAATRGEVEGAMS